jgi:hypothetical protein
MNWIDLAELADPAERPVNCSKNCSGRSKNGMFDRCESIERNDVNGMMST